MDLGTLVRPTPTSPPSQVKAQQRSRVLFTLDEHAESESDDEPRITGPSGTASAWELDSPGTNSHHERSFVPAPGTEGLLPHEQRDEVQNEGSSSYLVRTKLP